MKKRGALELSVNTIVVIVIGVTILILGLSFTEGLFSKINPFTQKTLEKVEGELDNIGSVDSLLTISPRTVQVELGKTSRVDITIANIERGAKATLTGVSAKITNNNPSCIFADSSKQESGKYSIPPGKLVKLTVFSTVGFEMFQ